MVAEALAEAAYCGAGGTLAEKEHLHRIVVDQYRPETRFVIRLLRASREWDKVDAPGDDHWRDWLRKLAREP